MKKIKKIIASITICSFLFVTSAPPAAAWETVMTLPMKQAMEEAFDALWGMLLTALKQVAIKTVREQVEKMVSGSTGENQIIMDYEEFIYESIQEESEEYLTDFFSSIQTGASPGESDMLRDVENSIRTRLLPPEPKSTLSDIVSTSDPIKGVFDQRYGGGVKALLSYEIGPYNNPFNAYYNTEEIMMQKIEQLQESQKAEGVAGQGFKTYTSGNNVMPGSIYQHLVARAEGAPIEMITNATKWQEVVASFATTLIGAAIKNGISTTSKSEKTDKKRVNRNTGRGYPGIQTDIYLGL